MLYHIVDAVTGEDLLACKEKELVISILAHVDFHRRVKLLECLPLAPDNGYVEVEPWSF